MVTDEIELGSRICSKLKRIYFDGLPWVKVVNDISIKFKELKDNMKGFYSGLNEMDMLKELDKYSDMDLKDCFNGERST